MKNLIASFVFLLTVTTNVNAQVKKNNSILSQKPISDSTKSDTLLIMNYQDAIKLLSWIDALHADHQEIKAAEKLIQSHIVVYPADKPKKNGVNP